jgi:hypothetical protein
MTTTNNNRQFYVLYTIEIDDDNKTDCRMITLYDPEEEAFYYYGTRSRTVGLQKQQQQNNDSITFKEDGYIQFAGMYPETKLSSYMEFYKLLNNKFKNNLTVEMHQIELDPEEYESPLNFADIFAKFSGRTEIYAYDVSEETEGSMMEKLDILTSIL